jgi:hypothetical protein
MGCVADYRGFGPWKPFPEDGAKLKVIHRPKRLSRFYEVEG